MTSYTRNEEMGIMIRNYTVKRMLEKIDLRVEHEYGDWIPKKFLDRLKPIRARNLMNLRGETDLMEEYYPPTDEQERSNLQSFVYNAGCQLREMESREREQDLESRGYVRLTPALVVSARKEGKRIEIDGYRNNRLKQGTFRPVAYMRRNPPEGMGLFPPRHSRSFWGIDEFDDCWAKIVK